MPYGTYFTTETKDIDKVLNTKEHTKIYLNIRKEEGKDILYCTKHEGQDLYIVSTNNYKNITEYFADKNNNKVKEEKEVKKKPEPEVKRQKQGSLLSFFKKK